MPAKMLRRRPVAQDTPQSHENEAEDASESKRDAPSKNRKDSPPAPSHWMLRKLVGGTK